MDRRLKRWELALLFGVLCALGLSGWLGQEQRELADQMIRLHVVANSDSAGDQALKLAVRDRVLERAQALCPQGGTRSEVAQILESHLDTLTAAAQEVVEEQGYRYPVSVQLGPSWFPTKEYEGFSLPAGSYTALRVVVGQGEGENWWCVVFPPLCLGAASETVDEAAAAGYFSRDQAALVTGESGGYVLKFKGMELLGQLKGLLD